MKINKDVHRWLCFVLMILMIGSSAYSPMFVGAEDIGAVSENAMEESEEISYDEHAEIENKDEDVLDEDNQASLSENNVENGVVGYEETPSVSDYMDGETVSSGQIHYSDYYCWEIIRKDDKLCLILSPLDKEDYEGNTSFAQYKDQVEEIIIEDGIRYLYYRIFKDFSHLSKVSIGIDVQEISSEAFYGCAELTSIDLRKATYIGKSAFWGCVKLSSIDFGEVTSIGELAFSNCRSLSSIDLGKVNKIENGAFFGCSLTKIIDRNYTGDMSVLGSQWSTMGPIGGTYDVEIGTFLPNISYCHFKELVIPFGVSEIKDVHIDAQKVFVPISVKNIHKE